MTFKIGDRVRLKDAADSIKGTVIRFDCGTKVVILDDDDSWQEEGEEASLTYCADELELIP